MNTIQRGIAHMLGIETRQQDYTAALVQAQINRAETPSVDVQSTGAAQACSTLIARALSTAEIAPAHQAVTRSLLYRVGIDLVLAGQSTWVIEVVNGRVVLERGRIVEALGASAATARYRIEQTAPDGSTIEGVYPPDELVMLSWETGRSPIDSEAGRALAALETAMKREAALSHGQFMVIPQAGESDTQQAVTAGLAAMAGKTGVLDVDLSQWQDSSMGRAFAFQRLGFSYPAGTDMVYGRLCEEVSRACGIPPALVGRSDGSALREGFRLLLHTLIAPLGQRIVEELSAKLDAPLEVDFAQLHAADVTGRARAFKGLIESGLSEAQAAQIVGFSLKDGGL